MKVHIFQIQINPKIVVSFQEILLNLHQITNFFGGNQQVQKISPPKEILNNEKIGEDWGIFGDNGKN